jgi:hypothetical protein
MGIAICVRTMSLAKVLLLNKIPNCRAASPVTKVLSGLIKQAKPALLRVTLKG